MHELYELKEMLMKELEEYGSKGEMTTGSLEVVDKLAHAIKNLCKIIEACEEEEYSSEGYAREGRSYRGGSSYDGGGGNRRSYANRRRSYARGSQANRDEMGRYASEGYSRSEEMVMQLRELVQDAPDEKTRMELQKFIQKMESM